MKPRSLLFPSFNYLVVCVRPLHNSEQLWQGKLSFVDAEFSSTASEVVSVFAYHFGGAMHIKLLD